MPKTRLSVNPARTLPNGYWVNLVKPKCRLKISKLNQAMTNIQQSDQIANQSNITQDIMRQISHQNLAESSRIQQSLQAETQQASLQMAAANMKSG